MTNEERRGKCVRSALLLEIADYVERHGYAPSIRELAAAINLQSHSTVHHHLERMRAEKLISYVDRVPRTLCIEKPYIYNTRRGDTNIKVISKWGKLHEQP